MSARPRSGPQVPVGAAAVLDAHASLINDALDAFWSWAEDTRWLPAARCQLVEEESLLKRQSGPAGLWDGADAHRALALASAFLTLSVQHLEGIRALLLSRHVIVPLAPLVRSSFEASCRIAWVLEPLGPDGSASTGELIRDRAARVGAIQIDDHTRAKTVAVALGDSSAPRWGAALKRMRDVTLPGRFYEDEIERPPNGTLVLRGQRLPGLRDGALAYEMTFGVNWSAAGAYDWLSNASHPTPSAVRDLTTATASGARRFQIDDVDYPAKLTRLALVPFLHCWQHTADYLATVGDDAQPLLDRANALLS